MTAKEISEELEVGKRQVIRYKEDLEMAGIYITTIPGRYGGYTLDTKDYILGLNITDEEYLTLLSAQENLKYENFIGNAELKSLVDKLGALREVENDMDFDFFIKSTKSNYDLQTEKKIWFDVKAAIISVKKVEILYKSAKGEMNFRVVHPYYIFQYKGSMYFAGFCEYRKEIRDFKISRIKEYEVLKENFSKDYNFNINDYMENCFGIFKDKEMVVKLEIKYPMAQIVKEKIWVDNQEIKECSTSNTIIYTAKMKGVTEIKSWILSMGSSVKILEPTYLRDKILKEAKKLLESYD